MKVVLAPFVSVGLLEGPIVDAEEFARLPAVEVVDDSEELLGDIVNTAVRDLRVEWQAVDRDVDAPPFGVDYWWVASVKFTEAGAVEISSYSPTYFYAVDRDGRVRFEHSLSSVSVADYVRAVVDGVTPSSDTTLVITRPGEFGGNGADIPSLVKWIFDFWPEVLVPLGIERAMSWRKAKKQKVLEDLADSWAARNIEHPRYLRLFVDSKRRWYPEVLGTRLGLSTAAARRLLLSLGYEPGEDEVMELRIGQEALENRDQWIHGEDDRFMGELYDDFDEEFGE